MAALTLGVDVALLTLILLVQCIIYPAFAEVERGVFSQYHEAYKRRISFFVIPLMTAQVGLHGWLVLRETGGLAVLSASLVVATWVSTWALSVPAHRRLSAEGNRPELVGHLVRSNWPRTLLWGTIAAVSGYRVWVEG